jgi:hypothetical protein
MITRRAVLGLCCLALPAVMDGLHVICVAVDALHAQAKPEPMVLTPAEMTWEMQGGPSGHTFLDPPDNSK